MNNGDAVWENPPQIAQGNFAEIKKNNLKIDMFFFIFNNFHKTWLWM